MLLLPLTVLAAAILLAECDLFVKAHAIAGGGAVVYHAAGSGRVLLSSAIAVFTLVLLLGAAPVPRARPLLPGLALVTAGAWANTLSLHLWTRGVPDPFHWGQLAFNLADTFVWGGTLLFIAAMNLRTGPPQTSRFSGMRRPAARAAHGR